MEDRMRKYLAILLLSLGVAASVMGHSRSPLNLKASYILPVEDSALNSSLILGIGSRFWGIFEFTGNAYLEINNEDNFVDKFESPNLFSAGVEMNIPMGGFRLKTDYQRFFALDSDNVLSMSQYRDSYKVGVGIYLDYDVELELYHRTFLNIDFEDEFDSQGFVGLGVNIEL